MRLYFGRVAAVEEWPQAGRPLHKRRAMDPPGIEGCCAAGLFRRERRGLLVHGMFNEKLLLKHAVSTAWGSAF